MQGKVQAKLKGLWEKVKGFFTKLNKKARILLGVAAAVILVLIIVAVLLQNRKEYALLYGGLTTNEINTIVSYLNDNGITDFQIQGDSVLVPKGRETQLQAQLAMSGYLTSGFMYEYWSENKSAISTANEQDKTWLIACEQKLAAVIRQIDGVRDAQVGISPGTERVYVLDPEATPATAYVHLELEGNQALSSQKVDAIRDIVSHGVERLEVSNVSVTDNLGNTYSDTTGVGAMSEASALQMQFAEETNNKVRSQVLNALTPIYGKDNVSVAVNTTVDMSRKVIDKTEYAQPEGATENGGLIGTQKWFWEIINDGENPVGGVVGTTSNADLPIYPDINTDLNGDENLATGQGEIDHKIDTTTTQQEVLAGTITDISVAVTINQDAPNANSVGVEDLTRHVATASGIGTDIENWDARVSVLIAPFNTTTVPDGPHGSTLIPGVENWVVLAALGGLLLFIILLVVILLLRSRSKKKKLALQKAEEEELMAAEAAAMAAAAAATAAPTGGADIMEVNTEKSMELRKTVRLFAQNNPEIAAQMVKAWLKGEESNAAS